MIAGLAGLAGLAGVGFRPLAGNGLGKVEVSVSGVVQCYSFRPLAGNGLGKVLSAGSALALSISLFPSPCGEWVRKVNTNQIED